MPKLITVAGLSLAIAAFVFLARGAIKTGIIKTKYDGEIRRDRSPIVFWALVAVPATLVVACLYLIYLIFIGAVKVV
jgi:hypothetical protein